MTERILIATVVVCLFVVIVRAIEEVREERRWYRKYLERTGRSRKHR